MYNDSVIFAPSEGTEVPEEGLSVFFGTEEVARSLRCSIPTAREIMHRKDFPLIQVGKNMRVLKAAFENWAMQKRE